MGQIVSSVQRKMCLDQTVIQVSGAGIIIIQWLLDYQFVIRDSALPNIICSS